MEIKKGQNILEHEDEIFSRPKKTWFTSEKGKADAQSASSDLIYFYFFLDQFLYLFGTELSKEEYVAASQAKTSTKGKAPTNDPPAPKRDKYAGLSRRAKRRKMAIEADKEYNDKTAVASAIRAAKHAQRPKKIGEEAPTPSFGKKKNKKDAAKGKKPGHSSAKGKVLGKDSKFKTEMSARTRGGGASSEGIRAKKGDGGILGGKKGGKGKGGNGKGRR